MNFWRRFLALTVFPAAFAAADPGDLLRFANGDQLHGSFRGIREGSALWLRDDMSGPAEFKTAKLRHIVLRGGEPKESLTSLSHVALVNGDRVMGRIVSMDATTLLLETSYAGTLKIPRKEVAMLAPSPLGGRLRYHGPFRDEGWEMANTAFPDGLPPEPPKADAKDAPKGDDKAPAKGGDKVPAKGDDKAPAKGEVLDKSEVKSDQPGRWQFSGSAWYWSNKSFGTALKRDHSMPDRAIFRFDIAWKNRLALAVAFHSDFAKVAPPKDGGDEVKPAKQGFVQGDAAMLPGLFGNSYVLQMFSTHMILMRTSVEDNTPSFERVQINGNALRLGDGGKTTVEIRCNKQSGEIAVFINDEFVVQWNEGNTDAQGNPRYAGKGSGFGFVVQSEDTQVKISDVMVAEWNGMPDSARSLQTDEQDVVLLSNGTDRFSGKVETLQDGKVSLASKYGQFEFDWDDIAEIRFARNQLAKTADMSSNQVVVRLHPLGQITGTPLSGTADSIRLSSPILGELDLNLDSAVMLDFQVSNNFIDDWDAEF